MHRIFTKHSDDLIFCIYLTPGSSKNSINGVRYENANNISIKISVHGKPIENQANIDLIKFISDIFDTPKSHIDIISGSKSRQKKLCLRKFSINDIPNKIQKILKSELDNLPKTLF